MAGHSKWANIRHQKGIKDRKRAQVNTQRLREIIIACRTGSGGSTAENPRLRAAVTAAKRANISKDKIQRAIEKGLGEKKTGAQIVTYEGRGPFGVALLIECYTDNVNRTVAYLRTCLHKHQAELTKSGSLRYLFKRKAHFLLAGSAKEAADTHLLTLMEWGVEDMRLHATHIELFAPAEAFGRIQQGLEELDLPVDQATLSYIPDQPIHLDTEQEQVIEQLLDHLQAIDDVQAIYHNLHAETL